MKAIIGTDLAKLVRGWRSVIDLRLKPLGLTQTHWITLFYLNQLPPNQSQIQLAKAIGIEQPSLVRTLDQLEKRELIMRVACPYDRRAKQISLRPEAKPVIDQVNQVINSLCDEILYNVKQEELDLLVDLIKRVDANITNLQSR